MFRKIDRLKQAALEKIGVVESTDVPKIKEDYKKLKVDEILFKELIKNMEKQLTYLKGFVDSGEDIKTNMMAWEKIVMERGENFKLVEGLKRFGDWQNSMNLQFSKLNQYISERVLEMTKTFVKSDIAEARNHKKKWVKLRQAYDASETKLAAAEKKGEDGKIKEEHAEIMKIYLKSELDTSTMLAHTLKGSENILIDFVGQYWDVYSAVFLQGFQLVERINSSLESLQLCPGFGALSRTMSMPNMGKKINNNNNNKEINSLPQRNPRVPNTKIFGIYLEDLWDKKTKSFPANLVQVIDHLEEHGPHEEEIFKLPGSAKNIAIIKQGLDEGKNLNSCGVLGDSLSVAHVFKDFLQQLPDPLIPSSFLSLFISASNLQNFDAKLEEIKRLCLSLPESHFVFLKMMVRMLGVLSRESVYSKNPDQTKKFINDMAIDLAIAIGPSSMRSGNQDESIETTSVNLFQYLILNSDSIFQVLKEELTPKNSRPIRAQSQPITVSKNVADIMKFEMNQLITEVIENLDALKMKAAATTTFEECGPFVLKIKNVLQNTLQIKSFVISEVAKVDKSSLQASEDKLIKAQNAIKIFAAEIQAILQAVKQDVNTTNLGNKDPNWKTICDNLQKTQSILLLQPTQKQL